MLTFGTDLKQVELIKSFFVPKLYMKDLGEVDVILGIKITWANNGLILSRSHYIEKVVIRFNNFDCKYIFTPFDVSLELKKKTGN